MIKKESEEETKNVKLSRKSNTKRGRKRKEATKEGAKRKEKKRRRKGLQKTKNEK